MTASRARQILWSSFYLQVALYCVFLLVVGGATLRYSTQSTGEDGVNILIGYALGLLTATVVSWRIMLIDMRALDDAPWKQIKGEE